MVKISIHGFYGMGNLGDEAILKSLINECSNYSDLELVVYSRNPVNVTKTHGIKAISSYKHGELFKRRSELKSSDLFILGGGGLLKDYGDSPASLQGWLRLLLQAQKLKIKTALFAIGAENIRYSESKTALQKALTKVDLISVRDTDSKLMLQSSGIKSEIKVFTDPAVLLTSSKKIKRRELRKPIRAAICVRHWFSKGNYIENPSADEKFKREFAKALDYLIENYNANLEFIPMRISSPDDDRIVASEIVSYMTHKNPIKIHNEVPEVEEFIKILDNYSLLFGMRLHSLILGASLGIPVIGLNYMPKVAAFMKSINEDEYSLKLENVTTDEIRKCIDKTVTYYNSRSKKILKEMSSLQKIAKRNIEEIIELTR